MTAGMKKFWSSMAEQDTKKQTTRLLEVASHVINRTNLIKQMVPEIQMAAESFDMKDMWKSNGWNHIEYEHNGAKVVVTIIADADSALLRWHKAGKSRCITVDLKEYFEQL